MCARQFARFVLALHLFIVSHSILNLLLYILIPGWRRLEQRGTRRCKCKERRRPALPCCSFLLLQMSFIVCSFVWCIDFQHDCLRMLVFLQCIPRHTKDNRTALGKQSVSTQQAISQYAKNNQSVRNKQSVSTQKAISKYNGALQRSLDRSVSTNRALTSNQTALEFHMDAI